MSVARFGPSDPAILRLAEELRTAEEQYSAMHRHFKGEFSNETAQEIGLAIGRLPDAAFILECAFWGLLEPDQLRLINFMKTNDHGQEPASEPTPAEAAPPRRGRPKGSKNKAPARRKPGR